MELPEACVNCRIPPSADGVVCRRCGHFPQRAKYFDSIEECGSDLMDAETNNYLYGTGRDADECEKNKED